VPFNANTAKVLLAYNQSFGQPSSEDVRQYCLKEFGGKALPNLATAVVYPDKAAIAVVVEAHVPTRKFSERTTMATIVAGTRYIDTTMNETWDVKEKNGTKFLAKVCDENLDQIIGARRARMAVKASTITLTACCNSAGLNMLDVGDLVKVMIDSRVMSGAEVEAMNGNLVTVVTREGETHEIPREAVLQVQQLSPAKQAAKARSEQEYFSRAYGDPEFAEQLVGE
jgi:hypothetical protein